MSRPAIWISALCLAVAVPNGAQAANKPTNEPAGVTLLGVTPGSAGEAAGLRAGDVLLSWHREAARGNPHPARGTIAHPYDVQRLEFEEAPRGTLRIQVRRADRRFEVELGPNGWRIRSRPDVSPAAVARLEKAEQLLADGEREQARAIYLALAADPTVAGKALDVSWFYARATATLAPGASDPESDEIWEQALAYSKESGNRYAHARQLMSWAAFGANREISWSLELTERAIAELERLAANGERIEVEIARFLNSAAIDLWRLDELARARGYLLRALELTEAHAPDSPLLARTLNHLALVSDLQAERGRAEGYLLRARDHLQRIGSTGMTLAQTLTNLASLQAERGDLVEAERSFLDALEIEAVKGEDRMGVMLITGGLSEVAAQRGDLGQAERYGRRALAVAERIMPESNEHAQILDALTRNSMARGDLGRAAEFARQAVRIDERLTGDLADPLRLATLCWLEQADGDPDRAAEHYRSGLLSVASAEPTLATAVAYKGLARYSESIGDRDTAVAHLQSALAIEAREIPGSGLLAETYLRLGDVRRLISDLDLAQRRYEQSLEIYARIAPGSLGEATALHGIGRIHRARGANKLALMSFWAAIDGLEVQTSRLGGDYETRAEFVDRNAMLYRDLVALLVETGQDPEAFHVLERSRTRLIADQIASREMRFSADLDAELEREMRIANAAYDSALSAMLSADADAPPRNKLHARLVEARQVRERARAEVRLAAPQLAQLTAPESLDLAATRNVLDSGVLLLSFAVDDEATRLFAVGPGPRDFEVHTLPLGEATLAERIAHFRSSIHPGQPATAVRLLADRLATELLGPVADAIGGAERLLVVPDGPLHDLPFAALSDPGSDEPSYLVEALPIAVATSATHFGELSRRRPSAGDLQTRRPSLVAFGDPDYPAGSELVDRLGETLRTAISDDLSLAPLPGTRREVESLATIFPDRSRLFLGKDATEGRAKQVATEADLLHFACHGVVDESFPLESALVLSVPETLVEGEDNGLLQAWEIFEQMRIDADLVTLSACDTSRGKKLAGEGILGLARAFHYAGARTVLASQWPVGDTSTADLMTAFYRGLRDGAPFDESLRAAQLDQIRSATTGPTDRSHPFYWAAFQLIGDWR